MDIVHDRNSNLVRTDNQALVAEYHYNPLGFRRSWKFDTDNDGDVDGNDKTYHFVHDERWRIVATYRDSDVHPKEQFVYHAAGMDGYGSSSYIDAAILRSRDAVRDWTAAGGSAFGTPRYYLQNWRADVVAFVGGNGSQYEQVRYGEYGVPFGMPAGDVDGDGDVDANDTNQIQTWINGSTYDVRGDLDLDGDVDATDKTAAQANNGVTLGWGKLSIDGKLGGNRKGYAGYEFEPAASSYSLWHVRHRVLNSNLGRWTRRDHLGFVDGANLYQYGRSNPSVVVDPDGQVIWFIIPIAIGIFVLEGCSSDPGLACDGQTCTFSRYRCKSTIIGEPTFTPHGCGTIEDLEIQKALRMQICPDGGGREGWQSSPAECPTCDCRGTTIGQADGPYQQKTVTATVNNCTITATLEWRIESTDWKGKCVPKPGTQRQ